MNKPIVSFAIALCLFSPSVLSQTAGNLTLERWVGIPGGDIGSLKQNGISQRPADLSELLPVADIGQGLGGNYGARLRGKVTAPVTGNYTFYISSDDHGELWLSNTASGMDKKLIAFHSGWTGHNVWNKYSSQRSRSVKLQTGQQYYIEALMKEGGGGDHLSIGWSYESPVTLQQTDLGDSVSAEWTESDGIYVASVSAGDFWGSSDSGSLKLRAWSGDGEFIARITDMNNPHQWAKAGLTVRGGLGIDAQHATILRSGSKGMAFQRRATVGGNTSNTGHGNNLKWVKLIRKGDVVTSYISVDGISWKSLGSVTLASLPTDVYIGFSATNNNGTSPVEVTFSNFSASPLTADEVIPSSQLVSFVADALDENNDNLPDAWQALYPIAGSAYDQSEFGDPDGDLISNLEESQLGTNPTIASGRPGHWLRQSWYETTGYDVADLVQQDAFFGDPSFTGLVTGPVASQGVNDGTRMRTVLTAPETGDYHFWVSGRGGTELWLSTDAGKYAKRRIAHMGSEVGTGHGIASSSSAIWDTFASQMSKPVYLVAGQKYFIEVLAQNGHVSGDVSLAWARPGQEREYLDTSHIVSYAVEAADSDDDYLPDAWEIQYGLSSTDNGLLDRSREGENGDFDSDGLNNRLEYLAGTDPSNADTDGDGISDAAEINAHGTDPLTSDAPSEVIASTFDLGSYTDSDYDWSMVNGGLLSDAFRGSITWGFTAPSSGTWIIQVDTSLVGNLRNNEIIHTDVSIDGQFIGRYAMKYGTSHNAILRVISPSLSVGNHTLTLMIDNLLGRRSVKIHSVTLRQPSGVDADSDGTPDWVEAQLAGTDYVYNHASTSRVSPFCLEGRTRLRNSLQINGYPVLAGGDNTHWYANLALNASGETAYTASFANGQTILDSVTWQTTNVLDSETLDIRKNDELLLTAYTGNDPNGSYTVTIDSPALPGEFSGHISNSSAQATTVWTNHSLAMLTGIEGKMQGGWIPNAAPAQGYHVSVDGNFATAQLQFFDGNYTKVAKVRFDQVGDDITVYQIYARYKSGDHLGEDFDSNGASNAPVGAGGYGVTSLFATNMAKVYSDDASSPTRIKFRAPGEHTISASHSDGSIGTLTVNVLQAAMPDDTTALQNTVSYLELDNGKTSQNLYFEGGKGLDLGAVEILNDDSYRFRLYPRDGGKLGVVARLWQGGPILDVADINAVTLTDALQNDATHVNYLDDFPGYYILTTPMVVLDLPPGGRMEITIFRSGVTFLDGTKKKTIYADDVTNGIVELQFLFPQGMSGGYCHYIKIYDADGVHIGTR